jgi:hypothetical protein
MSVSYRQPELPAILCPHPSRKACVARYLSHCVTLWSVLCTSALTQQVGVDKEEGSQEPAVLLALGPALVVDILQQGADEEEGASDDTAGQQQGWSECATTTAARGRGRQNGRHAVSQSQPALREQANSTSMHHISGLGPGLQNKTAVCTIF